MLKQRVLTAIVLLVILAAAVSASSNWPFLIFISAACGVAGWEWVRLTTVRLPWAPVLIGFALTASTILQAYIWQNETTKNLQLLNLLVFVSVSTWIFGILPTLIRGDAQSSPASLIWTLFAPVALFTTWSALAYFYISHSAGYVLSVLVLIWIADIAAYFAGKAFGKHKLAPRISPGKTLEGAFAGVLGVVLWVLITALFWDESFGSVLVKKWGWLMASLFAVILAIISIAGDLFESLLKRRAGVKDSSALLPGHGGVYDRIDAVVAVVPLAYLLTELLS